MKSFIVSGIRTSKTNRNKISISTKNYLIDPLKSGFMGFLIFITIFIVVKLISYLIGSYDLFLIEITDIELSLIGFLLFFLIRFLENFK